MEKLKRQDERMRTSEGRARYLGGGFFLNMLTEEDNEENANLARETNPKKKPGYRQKVFRRVKDDDNRLFVQKLMSKSELENKLISE